MMDCPRVYVLTSLSIDPEGNVVSRTVGVTFSIHEAERHREKGVENEFETFSISPNWREGAAATDLVFAMREFCAMVHEWQESALRRVHENL